MAENRFAVPLRELDRAHVAAAEQVEGQAVPRPGVEAPFVVVPRHGDGAGGDADGD